MDAAGDGARSSDLEDDGWRRDAADLGRRSRTPLACGVGVGSDAVWFGAHHGGRSEWTRLCERCERGRPVVVSGWSSPFDPGFGRGWMQVPAGVQGWKLQRVRNVSVDGLAAPYAERSVGEELRCAGVDV